MKYCGNCGNRLNDQICVNEDCGYYEHHLNCQIIREGTENCTCNFDKPIDSQDYLCYSKGVRIIPKSQNIQINLPNGNDGCRLDVIHHDGSSKGYRISKRVAEVLISEGYSWGS